MTEQTLEKPASKVKDFNQRNDKVKRLYRCFSQAITITPSVEGDLSIPIGDLVSQGADIRFVGIEGEVSYTHDGFVERTPIKLGQDGKFPTFIATLNNGDKIDISKLKVAVDIDYNDLFFPKRTESYGKVDEIKDLGKLSPVATNNYNSLAPKEKFAWLSDRVSYLTSLRAKHELQLNVLVSRYKNQRRKLHDNRHLLLQSRFDTVTEQLIESKSWYNKTLVELVKTDSDISEIKNYLLDF
jgi:hypothetical protein